MTELKVPRKTRDQQKARIDAGKCLLCDKAVSRRGLCGKHYFQFYRAYQATPDDKKLEFEERHIKRGHVLPAHKMRAMRSDNPFKKNTG